MARGRFISESVAKDMRLNSLSVEAELVYLMAIPHLDRDGLIEGDTDILHGTVCPKRRHFRDLIEYYIEEWVACGLVTYYQSSEGPVLWFRGFAKNQTGLRYEREIPSIFPPPPGYKHTKSGLVAVILPEAASEQVDEAPPPSVILPQESSDTAGAIRQNDGGVRQTSAHAGADARPEVQVEVKDQVQELNDDDDPPARDAVHQAWFETYEAEMPEHLEQPIAELVIECGPEAAIHGVISSKQAKERTFKYISKCARNYIPPPPQNDDYANSNGYHVDIPNLHILQPSEQPIAPTALPPPMSHDDPWAVALTELSPTLVGVAASWLVGSQLQESGELAGVPLYRVLVTNTAANVTWLAQQAEPAIRKKLSSLFAKRILVEIVAATPTGEPA